MPESESAPKVRIELRWPALLAILALLFLLTALPGRMRLFPSWIAPIMGVIMIVPIAAVALTNGRAPWQRVERVVTFVFCALSGIATIANLGNLIGAMVNRPADVTGVQLLSSSIAVWATNVLMFALLYWQIDRRGPEGRATKADTRPDWLFPQTGVPDEAPPDWRPTFVDYLFLAFSTATAFSTTEVAPLTSRAKLLMMLSASISLVTLVLVASRAINILGN